MIHNDPSNHTLTSNFFKKMCKWLLTWLPAARDEHGHPAYYRITVVSKQKTDYLDTIIMQHNLINQYFRVWKSSKAARCLCINGKQ